MKKIITSVFLAAAIVLSARATDVSTKITDVHLCRQSCVKGVEKAVGTIV